MIMGKDDAARVELLQPVDPGRRYWQRRGMSISMGSPREHVGAVGGRGLVALAGHHESPTCPGSRRRPSRPGVTPRCTTPWVHTIADATIRAEARQSTGEAG
jgi:hypothetical protein